METKRFGLAEVLTACTGYLFCPIGRVYEILNWVTGDDIYTHQIPRAMEFSKPLLMAHFPGRLTDDLLRRAINALDGIEEFDRDERKRIIQDTVVSFSAIMGDDFDVPKFEGFRSMSNDNTTTERPILFSAPMIRAILAGTKTQTRLIVKPQPEWFPHHGVLAFDDAVNKGIKCPHGIVGDRLWVRETVELVNSTTDYFHDVLYCADGARVPISSIPTLDMDGFNKWLGGEPKHPSIHMPRWASRITLEITDIRVERLQDISEDDAWDEGFASSDPVTARVDVYERGDAIGWFQNLWGSINGDKAGCNWESNPWVWCISFRAVEAIQ